MPLLEAAKVTISSDAVPHLK
ncbi:uncharacterized protein G2W53_010231 [Senna tora]|uniref:Uncharacterized protein n=1 Tax=Senna tora TaxID=362788 RepID=A0A834WZ91_9FABA|nr:uncharacterized protein G2W53_010231 [Senna tora]